MKQSKSFSFFLKALFSAFLFSLLFLLNDLFDDLVHAYFQYLPIYEKYLFKFSLHFLFHLVLFLILLYGMHNLFGDSWYRHHPAWFSEYEL